MRVESTRRYQKGREPRRLQSEERINLKSRNTKKRANKKGRILRKTEKKDMKNAQPQMFQEKAAQLNGEEGLPRGIN